MGDIFRRTIGRLLLVWLVFLFTLGLVWHFIVNRV
jgi:hypothetical protein